jgi:cyclopropane fatty-acyl-phospholipid synthase-like methyltransferase
LVTADPRTRVVQAGYDAMAERYAAWGAGVQGDPRDRFLDQLMARLPPGGRVLDLGCGSGLPSTLRLVERFDVTGVDISAEQLRRAAQNLPAAELIHADIAEVEFAPGSFDGVVSFYVLGHLPREYLGPLFRRVCSWLRPSGAFLTSLGVGDDPDGRETWLGVPMFFSSHTPERNRELLKQAGLRIDVDELVTMREPEQEVTFQWVIASPAAD